MTLEKTNEVPAGWECAIVLDQAMADAIIPRVLANPAAGYMVWIDGITGPVDLRKYIGHANYHGSIPGHCVDIDGFSWHKADEQCQTCGWGFPNDPNHPSRVNGISWVRVSGGRGDLAVPAHPDWIRGLRDQCAAAGVLFRFDGWGEWVGGLDFYSGSNDEYGPEGLYAELQNGTTIHESKVNAGDWKNWDEDNPGLNDTVSVRVGAAASGRLLDGIEHLDAPAGVVIT